MAEMNKEFLTKKQIKYLTYEVLFMMIVVSILFSISLVSADSIGVFKSSEVIELYQTCNNCTYCNLSSIKYPDGLNILNNTIMNQDDSYFYYILNGNYTINTGIYTYCYDCGNDYERETGCLNFEITPKGDTFTTGNALVNFGFIFIIILIIFFFTYALVKNKEIYLKILSFYGIWFFLIVLFYLLWYIGENYFYSFNFLGDFFKWCFYLIIIATIPLFFGTLTWVMYLAIMNKEIKGMMRRGVPEDRISASSGMGGLRRW